MALNRMVMPCPTCGSRLTAGTAGAACDRMTSHVLTCTACWTAVLVVLRGVPARPGPGSLIGHDRPKNKPRVVH